jgi:MoxR-like ATPase
VTELKYVLSSELIEAIEVAEVTGRPLLLKGEPGTGKTLLAEYYAQKNKLDLFKWHIKSTSLAKDGLYYYDAITRLNDSRFASIDGTDVSDINKYIRLEAMGEAFSQDNKCILLIDEIDKGDIEFPNDLLLELDKMEFTISETGEHVKAKIRPLVFITSNNEKELPDAFLRRCIFHYIDFPHEEMMKEIVEVHYPKIDKSFLNQALDVFYSLRDDHDLKKKPATSELIDWINMLLHQGANMPSKGEGIPFLGSLLKSELDFFKYKKK